jgi:alcohol dehydrogenase
MRALVYQGPGQKAWEEVPDPEILDDGDAIVRIDATTICGTDLHILKGDVPAVHQGRILGHEAVGTVLEVGDGVRRLSPGDRVLVSCISACGSCQFCREGRYGQCLEGGGWVLGHTVDGTQAEFARVLYADHSTFRIPDGVSDEEALMLADILPTGYEVGVLAGGVRPGDVVAVVGAGPVGLSAITGARLFSPGHIVAIDLSDARLEAAKQFGADVTVSNSREDALGAVRQLQPERGRPGLHRRPGHGDGLPVEALHRRSHGPPRHPRRHGRVPAVRGRHHGGREEGAGGGRPDPLLRQVRG